MTTIHVELGKTCDGDELVEFLAARGLAGALTTAADHCEVEVGYAVDPDERLRQEFEAALGSWLERHEPALVPMVIKERGYVLRPPAD